jgi:electron transport complex protein RnfE
VNYWKEFTKGLLIENPVFVLLLGMCSALAVSNTVSNAIGMGVAFTIVLILSNIVISAIRRIVPNDIRIPVFIVVMAGFVTIIELLIKAYFPALDRSLGIFIPLIVVNCILLGRAEAFASKNGIMASLLDGLGMGAGYTIALTVLALFREIIGAGTVFGIPLFGANYQPALIMILPPGAFITLGLVLAYLNYNQEKKASKEV